MIRNENGTGSRAHGQTEGSRFTRSIDGLTRGHELKNAGLPRQDMHPAIPA